jgi:type III restriction enzyme
MTEHLKSYLKGEEKVRNVIIYYEKQLADFIHAQMLSHQKELASGYDVKITKGFTEIKEMNFTAPDDAETLNYRNSKFDKSKIGRIIFNGFSKCIYDLLKFDSDTERRFAVILENDSLKWLKPAKGQFQIYYRMGGEYLEYVPDFAAETADTIYLIETKARNELSSPDVLSKKEAAELWCQRATDYNQSLRKKPWKYLLIPHDEVQDNKTLEYFDRIMRQLENKEKI